MANCAVALPVHRRCAGRLHICSADLLSPLVQMSPVGVPARSHSRRQNHVVSLAVRSWITGNPQVIPRPTPKQAYATITSGLPTFRTLSDQITSKAHVYWRFAGFNALAVTCRSEPCGAVRRRSFRGRSLGSASSGLPLSRQALTQRCACRRARG
jgi:hypothetical protein